MAPGIEWSDLNWLAIVLAMVSNIVLGFLWYSPKLPTGRIWMKGAGIPEDMKMPASRMAVSFGLMIVGTFLLMFVLQHVFLAFRDAMTLDDAGITDVSYADGAMGAFFTWLGFFLPVQLGSVSWDGKSWSFFSVNAGYYFVTLMVAGMIFAAFI